MTIDVKGLVREYLLIIILYSLDLGTEFAVYTENITARGRYEKWLNDDYSYQFNRTTGYGICTSADWDKNCLLYTSPSPRDGLLSRMPSSA